MARDTVSRTFLVATVLCVVCSVVVSVAAVSLRPLQEKNKELDRKKNILAAAGLYDAKNPPEQSLDDIFADRVAPVLIDLESGEPAAPEAVDQETYDEREAAGDPTLSEPVEPTTALPGFTRRPKYAHVYEVKNERGELSQVVFPIYGKGLWSTLYGFIALESDGATVSGITFYEHGETPGLGGEVDNPAWKSQWAGKRIYDDQWNMAIRVIKGKVDSESPDAVYQVDGLSGATITTRGVSNLVRYWLGEDGFGPYLARMRGDDDLETATAATGAAGATDG